MTQHDEDSAGGLADASARALAPLLRQFLRSRYRLLADHDDLVQQTLGDLHRYLRERARAMLQRTDDELRALAFSILKRRVADRFRDEARAVGAAARGDASLASPLEPSAETVAGYRELLGTVLAHIAQMSAADRDLLLDEVAGSSPAGALPPAQRQRLSRLRARLRALLASKGIALQDMTEDRDA